VLTLPHRFLITENFGDFNQSFNIGKLSGGFGAASAKSASATCGTPSTLTNITPQSTSSSRGTRKRAPSFSPTSPPVAKTQMLADEFLSLTATRMNIMDKMSKEEDDEEKGILQTMLNNVLKRRKEVVELSAKST
jgi:hypothetical protein